MKRCPGLAHGGLRDTEDAPLLVNEDSQKRQDVESEVAIDSGFIVKVCHSDDSLA